MKRTSAANLRRTLAMIAALTMLLSCLAGCKKKSDEDMKEPDPTSESAPPTAATTTPPETTEATTPPETTPLSVWGTVNSVIWFGTTTRDLLQRPSLLDSIAAATISKVLPAPTS